MRPYGYRIDRDIRRFAELGSTNAWVLAQARAGAPAGLVAVADHQSAGRGRRGRTWLSRPGTALLASVLLRPGPPVGRWPRLVMAGAVALSRAAEDVAGVGTELKWPNDVVMDGVKVAGLLAETDPAAGAVVMGVGVNCTWSPPGAARLGPVDRDALLAAWLDGLDRAAGDWPATLAAYRRRSATLGRRVRVEGPAGPRTGTAVDVTDEGHLVLACGDGVHTVAAADVVHLRAGPG